jgi:pimeloyl-ACP methyl ester carboxylesterase
MRLHVHRAGSGEPLLLVHGIASSWRCWNPVLPALAERHEVLAVDLPGFGASPPLPSHLPRTVPAITDAVEAELDTRGIGTASIAGNSMGGWVALELARRGRAREVVAISPAGLGTPDENRRSRRRLLFLRAVARALAGGATAVTRNAPLRATIFALVAARPARVRPADGAAAIEAAARCPGFRRTLDWLFANQVAGLDEIRCPVKVLWGSRDLILSPRQAERFGVRIPHADVRRLPRLGHIPMSDDPELIASSILEQTGPHRGPSQRPIAGAVHEPS